MSMAIYIRNKGKINSLNFPQAETMLFYLKYFTFFF